MKLFFSLIFCFPIDMLYIYIYIGGGTKFKMPQKYIPETLYFTQCSRQKRRLRQAKDKRKVITEKRKYTKRVERFKREKI